MMHYFQILRRSMIFVSVLFLVTIMLYVPVLRVILQDIKLKNAHQLKKKKIFRNYRKSQTIEKYPTVMVQPIAYSIVFSLNISLGTQNQKLNVKQPYNSSTCIIQVFYCFFFFQNFIQIESSFRINLKINFCPCKDFISWLLVV